jgi:hypothetical protein
MKDKTITLKLIPIACEDVPENDQVCSQEHFVVSRRRVNGGRIYLCAPGVLAFFNTIDINKPVEIVLQTKEPRFVDHYVLKGYPNLGHWNITNARGGHVSPWTCEVDDLLMRLFSGRRIIYASAYQEV